MYTTQPIYKCPLDSFAPYPHIEYSINTNNIFQEYRHKKQKWKTEVKKAICEGKITPEKAIELGLNTNEKYITLPDTLYHVTTNTSQVIKEGLKTRDELNMQNGHGLGGGDSDTISFTESINTANHIKNALLEARLIAREEFTAEDMIEHAKTGTNANEPFLDNIMKYYYHNDEYRKSVSIEQFLHNLVYYEIERCFIHRSKNEMKGWEPIEEKSKTINGEKRYLKFRRKYSKKERIEKTFDLYKIFSAYREHAGGPMDPVFFLSNIHSFKHKSIDDIKILQYKPIPNGKGFQMNALGEWRINSGKAVKLTKIQ
jgi:hypothetical protein